MTVQEAEDLSLGYPATKAPITALVLKHQHHKSNDWNLWATFKPHSDIQCFS